MYMQVLEAIRTPNRQEQKRITLQSIKDKMTKIQNKEKNLKAARKKCQVTYKDKPNRIRAHFSTEILKALKT